MSIAPRAHAGGASEPLEPALNSEHAANKTALTSRDQRHNTL